MTSPKSEYCVSCGRPIKTINYEFCNAKCEKSYAIKQRQKRGRFSGRSKYREKEGFFNSFWE